MDLGACAHRPPPLLVTREDRNPLPGLTVEAGPPRGPREELLEMLVTVHAAAVPVPCCSAEQSTP